MTLIEIVAALGVAGLVVIGAALMLDQINDAGARIVRDGATFAREGNGLGLLRELLANATASDDTSNVFRGAERTIAYRSRCTTTHGWLAPCRVTMSFEARHDSSLLTMSIDSAAPIAVYQIAGTAELRYLNAASTVAESLWVRVWETGVTIPAAVGMFTDRDSVVLAVGPSRE